ncbi:hypothetical protein ThrDRAFT_01217 [Frankia casuarinae]|nr:hypothetical protein ThrDRAFT_01217 [Frankia casuarinae]
MGCKSDLLPDLSIADDAAWSRWGGVARCAHGVSPFGGWCARVVGSGPAAEWPAAGQGLKVTRNGQLPDAWSLELPASGSANTTSRAGVFLAGTYR